MWARILLFLLCLYPHPAYSADPATIPAPPELSWRSLEPGLELGLAVLPESRARQNNAVFVVLRVSPTEQAFALCMASQTGAALSLAGWSEQQRLRAGINAGMYLPDQLTNTGYMRNGKSVNNDKLGGRLGAFFVAGPRNKKLPLADVMDRESPDWQARLDQYDIVAQNFRLVNSRGELLWPDSTEAHSIAAIARDGAGRILFILSQEPLTVQAFARYLAHLPLDAGTVMYVEGGRQAGLFVRLDTPPNTPRDAVLALPGATAHPVSGGTVMVWRGKQSLLKLPGSPDAALPNIIGVKMR